MSGQKSLSKKAVRRCWAKWLFFNQSNYNYERYMGTGYLDAMLPAIDELYSDDDQEKKNAMIRHSGFFNCEPCFASPIVGLTVAMEEQKAKGKDIDEDAITSIKSGLMGPASGIGDTVIQGVIVPLLLAMAIDVAQTGNIVGPLLYCIVITAIVLGISYGGFMLGYKKGSDAIISMMENGLINKVIKGAGIMGCMVMGALVAKYVNLSCAVSIPYGESVFSIQTSLFDVLLPKMLPLLLTLGVYKLLAKGTKSLHVILYIAGAGLALGLLHLI